ncbi:MAG: class I SAM-dependent methyltransferase [Bacteroidota bacterium]
MSDPAVMQLRILSEITRDALEKYRPATLAVFGCAGGNGFEHIDPGITIAVHGVDINREYLKATCERYGQSIPGLQLHSLDLDTETIPFRNIDLGIAALVLEYLDVGIAIGKMAGTLQKGGILLIVLVNYSEGSSFVSPGKYKSLQQLSTISKIINEHGIIAILPEYDLFIEERSSIKVNDQKQFIILHCRKQINS